MRLLRGLERNQRGAIAADARLIGQRDRAVPIDRVAIGVMLAAHSQGRRQALAGVLDGARPQPGEVGCQAIERLVDIIEGREPSVPKIFVPTALLLRGCTRHPAPAAAPAPRDAADAPATLVLPREQGGSALEEEAFDVAQP